MPQNLELKVSLSSVKAAERVARSIGARKSGILHQVDTYFAVHKGRLKLREVNSRSAELIYYIRPNQLGSRFSNYMVIPTSDSKQFKEFLSKLYRQSVVVHKTRRLYLLKEARIHIDSVRGLGNFLEFEVLVNRGRLKARAMMKFLQIAFAVSSSKTIGFSYSDLLRKRGQGNRKHKA